jgi:hypothetical protein
MSMRGLFGSLLVVMTVAGTNVFLQRTIGVQ